jgi:alkaline phosphatase
VLDPAVSPGLIYAVVFLSCVLESFFPPWPTDVISVYAGFLAGRGQLDHRLVLGSAVTGTQLGVMTAFWIGRHWGHALLTGPLGRWLRADRLARLERWFERYGAPAVAISRFFPGIRALVMPAAGLAGFSAWKVLLWAGLSVVVWNVLVVGLGVIAGTHLDWARRVLVRYNLVAGIVVLAAIIVAGFLVVRARARRSATS